MPLRLPTTAVLTFVARVVLCPLALCSAALGQSTPVSETVAKSAAPAAPASASPDPASTAIPPAPTPPIPAADTAQPKPGASAKAANAASKTLFFYTSPRSTVEMEVHSIPASNNERLQRLRENFAIAGCSPDHMSEQKVVDKRGEAGANLICVWPGDSPDMIVVGAHYEHVGQGDGALADWSGAALLPFLYQAVQGQPRQNTYIFLESWKREGADTWLKSLSKEGRKHLRAMIDLDALGLSYTRFFTTFSPFETAPPGAAHLQAQLLWSAISDGVTQAPEQTSPHHWLSVDPTDPFRAQMVPTIVIHSVPADSATVPGSAADIASAVNGNAYFQTYHLMCAYLTSLDHVADKLNTHDRLWETGPVDFVPEQETPRVTFRTFSNGRLMPTPPPQ